MEPTRIDVAGTFNFRDIGGWPAAHGHVVTGRVFRSDGLGRLTSASLATLRHLDVRTVIDLREERERHHIPDQLGDLGATEVHVPLFGNRLYPLKKDRPDRLRRSHVGLEELYGLLLDEFGDNLVKVIELVAHSDGPVLYHCSAGKDRTGVITAFILELVGVSRANVVTDYNATERFLGQEFLDAISAHFADAGIVANLSHTATQAPRVYMENLLTRVDTEFGGVENYLLGKGMPADTPERLKRTLLVD